MSKNNNNLKIQNFKSRFIIISLFFVFITSISWFFTFNTDFFLTAVKISSFGLLLWIIFEFDLLKENKVYLMLFSLSLVMTLVGYYLLDKTDYKIWIRTTKLSLFFLILYKILRYFYILTYKREPKFERSNGLIADRIFSFFLIIGTILATMSI
jgi:hypothetical protein